MGLAGAAMEGAHEAKAVLRMEDQEIGHYSTQANSQINWGLGASTQEVATEADKLQTRKIAVALANSFNADRALIVNKTKKQTAKQDSAPQPKTETQKATTEKLDKLRKDGVISEDEYRRAKDKILPPQTDDTETAKKLQELDDLHKKGILSDDDYNKAKKRVIELQKLNELRQSGILSEEEYNKAKARLTDKRDVGKE